MAFEYKHLIDAPINTGERANKIWLPHGKKPQPKVVLSEEEKLARLANSRMARAQAKEESERKLSALMDYYAGTSVPFDRIAGHTNLSADDVRAEMAKRGRKE